MNAMSSSFLVRYHDHGQILPANMWKISVEGAEELPHVTSPLHLRSIYGVHLAIRIVVLFGIKSAEVFCEVFTVCCVEIEGRMVR